MRIPSARLALPVLVWAILYATHVLLGYYHDDYAYAGLTYFYTVEGPYSERLTLLNYVNYLYQHYMGWGGRIVAFGIAIPFMHAGPSVFWLVQSLLVTGILCFGASIVSRVTVREDFPQTLLFLLASYMSMKITLVRDGLYWGSASVLYVWPMFFLLWAIFLIMREPLRKRDTTLAAVLFFIASASSEPFSLYAFAFVGVRLLVDIVEKKKRLHPNLLWLSTSLAGFLFCFLAPGNVRRAMNFPSQNIPPLAELLRGIPDAFTWITNVFPLCYPPLLLLLTLLALCFYALRIGMAKEKNYWQLLPLVVACCSTTCLFLLPVARNPRVLHAVYPDASHHCGASSECPSQKTARKTTARVLPSRNHWVWPEQLHIHLGGISGELRHHRCERRHAIRLQAGEYERGAQETSGRTVCECYALYTRNGLY